MSDDVIQTGRRAASILHDDVFQQAVQEADQSFVLRWRYATTTEERERAHALQTALVTVVQELEILMGNGLMEEAREQ